MKKLLALLLALMMALSLVACGGDSGADEPSDNDVQAPQPTEDPADDGETEGTGVTDQNGEPVSEETIAELTQAYNDLAIPYNEIATAANENGWMADEQTAAELDAVGTTLGFIGAALTEDITMLDGTDFEALILNLQEEFPAALEILNERVFVPYEG